MLKLSLNFALVTSQTVLSFLPRTYGSAWARCRSSLYIASKTFCSVRHYYQDFIAAYGQNHDGKAVIRVTLWAKFMGNAPECIWLLNVPMRDESVAELNQYGTLLKEVRNEISLQFLSYLLRS